MEATIRDLTDLSGIDEQLGEKTGHFVASLAALEKRRARLRKKIPGLLLASYDALARVGRRPVVVPLKNAHCSGCCLRLPPQLDSSIRRHRTLCPCPYCHRLLYAPASDPKGGHVEPRHRHPRPKGEGTQSIVAALTTSAKPGLRVKASRRRSAADLRRRSAHEHPDRTRPPGARVDHVN